MDQYENIINIATADKWETPASTNLANKLLLTFFLLALIYLNCNLPLTPQLGVCFSASRSSIAVNPGSTTSRELWVNGEKLHAVLLRHRPIAAQCASRCTHKCNQSRGDPSHRLLSAASLTSQPTVGFFFFFGVRLSICLSVHSYEWFSLDFQALTLRVCTDAAASLLRSRAWLRLWWHRQRPPP